MAGVRGINMADLVVVGVVGYVAVNLVVIVIAMVLWEVMGVQR